MTSPRLQREFDRLYGKTPRLMTDREVDDFFAGKPMRHYPLPFAFYVIVGALATLTLAAITYAVIVL